MASMWKNVSCLLRQASAVRGFRTSAKKLENVRADASFGETQRPTNFQKKTLVWAKMYKNANDIPERVSNDKLKKAQRVYWSGLLLAFTAVGGVVYYLTSRNKEQIEEGVKTVREKIPAVAKSINPDANKDGGKDGGKKADSDKQKK